jgi:hypothetical protein
MPLSNASQCEPGSFRTIRRREASRVERAVILRRREANSVERAVICGRD